jgi:hypothetical protein
MNLGFAGIIDVVPAMGTAVANAARMATKAAKRTGSKGTNRKAAAKRELILLFRGCSSSNGF